LAAAAIVVAVVGLSIAGVLLVARRRGADRNPPPETSPTISLPCPGCRRKVRARAEQAGKKVKCPYCATALEGPPPEAGLPAPRGPRPGACQRAPPRGGCPSGRRWRLRRRSFRACSTRTCRSP